MPEKKYKEILKALQKVLDGGGTDMDKVENIVRLLIEGEIIDENIT